MTPHKIYIREGPYFLLLLRLDSVRALSRHWLLLPWLTCESGLDCQADQDDGTELLQCFQFQGVPARQQQIRIFGKFVLLILETDHQSQSLSYPMSCLWCLSWNDKEIHNSWQRAQQKKEPRLLLLMECRQWWSLYSLTLTVTSLQSPVCSKRLYSFSKYLKYVEDNTNLYLSVWQEILVSSFYWYLR